MTDAPSSRSLPIIGAIVGVAGLLLAVLGGVLTFGGWRGRVDLKLEDLDRRMTVAEANQRQYIPVLIGMKSDLAYLADRARREDDRAERVRRR